MEECEYSNGATRDGCEFHRRGLTLVMQLFELLQSHEERVEALHARVTELERREARAA